MKRLILIGLMLMSVVPAQLPPPELPDPEKPVRLPNGRLQSEAIIEEEYKISLAEAKKLVSEATEFEQALEKDSRWVLSLKQLKRLEEIERLAKKLRSRLKR